MAELLAAGLVELLGSLRGPSTLRLTGLPLGDPTVRALAARLPTAVVANERSRRLVDGLDGVGDVQRSRDPAVLERWLPALLSAAPPRSRRFLRAAARLHAAIGQLELAVIADGETLRAGLLTLVDGVRPLAVVGDDLDRRAVDGDGRSARLAHRAGSAVAGLSSCPQPARHPQICGSAETVTTRTYDLGIRLTAVVEVRRPPIEFLERVRVGVDPTCCRSR